MKLVWGAVILAAACGDNSEDTRVLNPPRDSYGTWEKHELPGTLCGNNSQYKFWSNFSNTSDNLVVVLEPGGACWDFDSCTGVTGVMGAANPDGLPDDHYDLAPFISPFLNRGDDTSPSIDWNYVYVPYCTGDVHTGNATAEYENDDGPSDMEKVTAWIDSQFTHVPKMLVTGCSAGDEHLRHVRELRVDPRGDLLHVGGAVVVLVLGGRVAGVDIAGAVRHVDVVPIDRRARIVAPIEERRDERREVVVIVGQPVGVRRAHDAGDAGARVEVPARAAGLEHDNEVVARVREVRPELVLAVVAAQRAGQLVLFPRAVAVARRVEHARVLAVVSARGRKNDRSPNELHARTLQPHAAVRPAKSPTERPTPRPASDPASTSRDATTASTRGRTALWCRVRRRCTAGPPRSTRD